MPVSSPRATARDFRIPPPAFYGDIGRALEVAIPDPIKRAPLRDIFRQMIEWQRLTVEAVTSLRDGHHNGHGTVTLDANQASTTLLDRRIGANTKIQLNPTSANAKAEGIPWHTYPNMTEGQAVLNHTNNAQTDRSYSYILAG